MLKLHVFYTNFVYTFMWQSMSLYLYFPLILVGYMVSHHLLCRKWVSLTLLQKKGKIRTRGGGEVGKEKKISYLFFVCTLRRGRNETNNSIKWGTILYPSNLVPHQCIYDCWPNICKSSHWFSLFLSQLLNLTLSFFLPQPLDPTLNSSCSLSWESKGCDRPPDQLI